MLAVLCRMKQMRPMNLVRSAWRTIMRQAYEAVGRYWVENFLPLHFKPGAASKYHYAFRSEAYLLRKFNESHGSLSAFHHVKRSEHFARLRKMDDQEPLVLTGRMRDQLLTDVTIRGFPSRCTVHLHGPEYLNAKLAANFRSRSNALKYAQVQPDKVKEVTTVLESERKTLSKVLVAAVAGGIAYLRGGERITGQAA